MKATIYFRDSNAVEDEQQLKLLVEKIIRQKLGNSKRIKIFVKYARLFCDNKTQRANSHTISGKAMINNQEHAFLIPVKIHYSILIGKRPTEAKPSKIIALFVEAKNRGIKIIKI